ncbi:MAG: helix-turn-helix domain-containing protein [Oscillospiraceae bacterium]|nr:helix-turn-helix domain-containing protein [Oscillospiraceae bacterium]MBO4915863.1 helix-turn-helix domain-containing protein [Oscillospiraceae bacterium]
MVQKPPDRESWANRLLVEGVNFKGYGVIPKYAMRDPDLSITAKGIYAYFCAMSGSGNSTFPSVETILAHLSFRSETYYAHRQQLVDQGYIRISSKERKGGAFANNVFTLIANPKKFAELTPKNDWQNEVFSTIEHEGLKAAGYGTIPKAVMQDPRLDVKAKAVYAYFASYAGAGRAAFPPSPQIVNDLGVSKPTYQKALRSLQELGYISVEQANWTAGSKGFGAKRYILNEKPGLSESKKPETVKSETAISETVLSEAAESETKPSKTVKSKTEKPKAIKNNSPFKTSSLSNNNPSTITGAGPIDGWDCEAEEDYETLIKTNVQYDSFAELIPYPELDKAKELVLLMITACESTGDTVRIGGEAIPVDKVRKRMLSLNVEHIIYVLNSVAQYAGQIRNIRAYNLAALYHASETLASYIDNENQAP